MTFVDTDILHRRTYCTYTQIVINDVSEVTFYVFAMGGTERVVQFVRLIGRDVLD